MELTINFEKKYVYGISLILIVLIGMFSVIAYTYTNTIPSPGHGGYNVWIDVQELTGIAQDEKTLQDAIDNGDFSGRQGVPVRTTGDPTNDCSEETFNNPICNNEVRLESITFNQQSFCALRNVVEWTPVVGDGKQSSCIINLIAQDTWKMTSDGASCIAYCLNWE